MKILVDDKTKEWEYENDLMLSDVIMDINQRLLIDEKRIVIEFKIDDTDEKVDMNLTPDQVSSEHINQISFKTQELTDFLQEELKTARETAEKGKKDITKIVDHIIAEEKEVGMNLLTKLFDRLMWIFNMVNELNTLQVFSVDQLIVKDKPFSEFLDGFNDVLKDLIGAMENQDDILVNDFLEYEVEPALTDLALYLTEVSKSLEGKDWSFSS